MERPDNQQERHNSDEADELRHKISKLVVQGFINNGDSSKDALLELEAMGLDLTEIDKSKMILSEIVTNFLNQLEKK